MDKSILKKIFSFFIIIAGAILLVIELGTEHKNYYLQCLGIVFLMTGLFLVNTKIASKELREEIKPQESFEEE